MKIADLLEGITIDPTTNTLSFNYSDNNGTSTKLGKGKKFPVPYIKKDALLDGYAVYSVYAASDAITTDVLMALKRKSNISINPADYKHFIKRTAIFISAKILAQNKIDVIITPKASTDILNDLLHELKERNSHIIFNPESIIKMVDFSKIIIDRTDPRITPAIIVRLELIIKNAMKTGVFEVKKALPVYRKFFKNYFDVVDANLFSKLEGKNVCVIDDIMSIGTTQLQLMRIIADYAPEMVIGANMFKTA